MTSLTRLLRLAAASLAILLIEGFIMASSVSSILQSSNGQILTDYSLYECNLVELQFIKRLDNLDKKQSN